LTLNVPLRPIARLFAGATGLAHMGLSLYATQPLRSSYAEPAQGAGILPRPIAIPCHATRRGLKTRFQAARTQARTMEDAEHQHGFCNIATRCRKPTGPSQTGEIDWQRSGIVAVPQTTPHGGIMTVLDQGGGSISMEPPTRVRI
jgi:hypothetical protein